MEFAFLDLEIIVLYIGYKLGKIRFFRQLIAIGHDAQTSLGTWYGDIEQVGIVGKLRWFVVYCAYDDAIALPTLIFMYRTGNIMP